MDKTKALAALDMIKYHHNKVSEPALNGCIKIIREALETQAEPSAVDAPKTPERKRLMLITQEDLGYLVGLLETIADPAGDGVIYHEVRLSPENTKEARDRWNKIKERTEDAKKSQSNCSEKLNSSKHGENQC